MRVSSRSFDKLAHFVFFPPFFFPFRRHTRPRTSKRTNETRVAATLYTVWSLRFNRCSSARAILFLRNFFFVCKNVPSGLLSYSLYQPESNDVFQRKGREEKKNRNHVADIERESSLELAVFFTNTVIDLYFSENVSWLDFKKERGLKNEAFSSLTVPIRSIYGLCVTSTRSIAGEQSFVFDLNPFLFPSSLSLSLSLSSPFFFLSFSRLTESVSR